MNPSGKNINPGNIFLFLSWHTPPAVRPQAILFNKMVKEFLAAGLNPIICTGSQPGWGIGCPVVNLPPDRRSLFNRLPFLREIKNWLYIERLYRQLKKIVKENGIKVVFSFSNPAITNVLGALLKKRLSVKFISHFSDPWYNSPLRHDPPLAKYLIGLKETFIIKQSDKIIFTNDNALEFIMSRYPAEWKKKAVVIPHSFSEADYPKSERQKHEKYILSHIGVFYEQRKPDSFFRAISLALKKYPGLSDKLEVRLVGGVDTYTGYSSEKLRSLIKFFGLEDIVMILPRVGYQESIKLMVESDCLLVIDPDIEYSPFLPSKLIDYAGSRRTIVGITPEGSPTAKFLEQAGYRCFGHDGIEALADYLILLIKDRPEIIPNQDYISKFEAKNTATQFMHIFKEISQL